MSEKTTVTMHLPNGTVETMQMKSIFFGGMMNDGTDFPCGGFHGSLSFNESTTSMIQVMRSFIKLCEDQNIPIEVANMTLNAIVEEAVKRERANLDEDNVDLETHMLKIRNDKPKK